MEKEKADLNRELANLKGGLSAIQEKREIKACIAKIDLELNSLGDVE